MAKIEENKILQAIFSKNVAELSEGKLFPISRKYAIDSCDIFSSTTVLKLWFKAGAQVIAIALKDGDRLDPKPFVAKISYPREDASVAIGETAVGNTFYIASPIIQSAKELEVALVLSSKEVLVIKPLLDKIGFNQLFDTFKFDINRAGIDFEPFSYTGDGKNAVDFISGAWQLNLKNQKKKSYVINQSDGKARCSIITIFYKNTTLPAIFPILAKVFELGPSYELIFCFQEAYLFRKQIEWLRVTSKIKGLNIKIILFEDNIGFSAANNVGVEYSAGEVIMLLNPDIVVKDINIFDKIYRAALAKRAVIGSTLLGISGDVMHNGISFEKELSFNLKQSLNISRTFHIGRHAQQKTIRNGVFLAAEATTGALICVSKKIWNELGGLSERYIYAHFEDVDFCHRASALKIPILIQQNKSIIHLESFSSGEEGPSRVAKLINSNIFNRLIGGTS
jgi:GT2 family glycosyltransferase